MLLAAVPPGSCFSATLVICPPTPSVWQTFQKMWNQGPREGKPLAWVTQRKWGVGVYPTISHGLKPDTPPHPGTVPQFPFDSNLTVVF